MTEAERIVKCYQRGIISYPEMLLALMVLEDSDYLLRQWAVD